MHMVVVRFGDIDLFRRLPKYSRKYAYKANRVV